MVSFGDGYAVHCCSSEDTIGLGSLGDWQGMAQGSSGGQAGTPAPTARSSEEDGNIPQQVSETQAVWEVDILLL